MLLFEEGDIGLLELSKESYWNQRVSREHRRQPVGKETANSNFRVIEWFMISTGDLCCGLVSGNYRIAVFHSHAL